MTDIPADFASLPSPCILQVFCLAECARDAASWRITCRRFHDICGKVAMLRLNVLGDAKPAVSALDGSSGDIATWYGLDLDFAPMELVQLGRITSPYVLRSEQAKLVELVMQHLHAGIRWARLAEPASFCLPYHLHKMSELVSLELVLNAAMEEIVFASAALANLHSLRRLVLHGRLPAGRRRMQRRALPHLGPSVAYLAAHGLNLGGTEWSHFRHLRSLDLSQSDVRLGPYCGGLLANLRDLVLREASLELSTPAIFADMASLTRLDLEGCTSTRTGSWLSRMLGGGIGGGGSGSASDALVIPAGLVELRAMGCNVFDKCALELGGAAGLRVLELSSGVQLPAALKHAAAGVTLGLHVAEEGHVVSRHGRDTICLKACLAERLPYIQRLSGWGVGRSGLAVVGDMLELRQLCLLAGERRRLDLRLDLPHLHTARIEGYQINKLDLPVCLRLHTVVLSGHGVCSHLALPPSTRVLMLDNVMRDPRTLSLATMVPRLKVAVLGMGLLPASLPATVERLAIIGEPTAASLAQAYTGLQLLLPQLPHLRDLRLTSGEAELPEAVSSLLPPGCQFSTAGMPREAPGTDRWGRSLHQTAPLRMDWCERVLTTTGINLEAIEAGPEVRLVRTTSLQVSSPRAA